MRRAFLVIWCVVIARSVHLDREPLDERGTPPDARRQQDDYWHRLRRRVVPELRWWFPGSLGVFSASAGVGLLIATNYYRGFYEAFGVSTDQAGVTKSETLYQLLPSAAGVALGVFAIRMILIVFWALPGKVVVSPASRRAIRTSGVVAGLALIVGALIAVGQAQELGRRDARTVITSTRPYISTAGLLERVLGLRSTSIFAITWVGPEAGAPDGANPLSNKPIVDGVHQTFGRLIGRNGETVMYFDLIDCNLYSEPAIDLSMTSAPTIYLRSGQSIGSDGLRACRSTIR